MIINALITIMGKIISIRITSSPIEFVIAMTDYYYELNIQVIHKINKSNNYSLKYSI